MQGNDRAEQPTIVGSSTLQTTNGTLEISPSQRNDSTTLTVHDHEHSGVRIADNQKNMVGSTAQSEPLHRCRYCNTTYDNHEDMEACFGNCVRQSRRAFILRRRYGIAEATHIRAQPAEQADGE